VVAVSTSPSSRPETRTTSIRFASSNPFHVPRDEGGNFLSETQSAKWFRDSVVPDANFIAGQASRVAACAWCGYEPRGASLRWWQPSAHWQGEHPLSNKIHVFSFLGRCSPLISHAILYLTFLHLDPPLASDSPQLSAATSPTVARSVSSPPGAQVWHTICNADQRHMPTIRTALDTSLSCLDNNCRSGSSLFRFPCSTASFSSTSRRSGVRSTTSICESCFRRCSLLT
jgi:hypothetical protein